jgi:hypothetical protein
MAHNIMFSGGIPADNAEGVFTLLSESVGDRAVSWPDGETTPGRAGWIGGVNARVLSPADCFEYAENPDLGYDEDRGAPDGQHQLRIRPGATVDLRGKLPYAADALESYKVFTRMKDEGKIPAGTLFQVSVPGAHDVVSISFPDVDEWPVVMKAWQEALQEEYRRILEVVPADELCIQIDFCTEMIHIGGAWAKLLEWVPDLPAEELFARYTSPEYILPHLAGLPDEVRIGFHICCGTSPYFPVQPLDDIGLPVRLANAIQAASGGAVDYFHLPSLEDSGEAFFAPLADLATGDATIYLGIEVNDGLEAMDRRAEAARKYLPDFGVAHYCGYFWNKEIMPGLLKDLAAGADHQAAAH